MHCTPSCHGQASDLQVQSSWRGYSRVCLYALFIVEGGRGQGFSLPGLPVLHLLRSWSWSWVLGGLWCCYHVDRDGFGGWGPGKLVSGWIR